MEQSRRETIIAMSLKTRQLTDKMTEVKNTDVFTWLYFPVKSTDFFEASIFSKAGLFKCRIHFTKPSYCYSFYYGTRLLGKSTHFRDYKTYINNYINE